MNKFKWIRTNEEYTKFIKFIDREINSIKSVNYQNMDKYQNYYIKLINDRDELLDHASNLKLKEVQS